MILVETVYFVTAVFLSVYGFHSLLMTGLFLKYKKHAAPSVPPIPLDEGVSVPNVTVQLPLYNERHVASRLLDAVVKLDWPSDRLQIQILDDSTDDTTQIVAVQLPRYRASGIDIEHIHRSNRDEFKAGALQNGLATATGEFIAIFDADFIPAPDFLRQTMVHFGNGRNQVGCVQTRWGHINPETSWLTRAQAMGIDGHFIVEQSVRASLHAFLNFNGTGGIWRRICIDEAGGWQGDTLTEDLDLSYRAQLCGWEILFKPEIVVPAELPVQLEAFKSQQFRWAKGSIQTSKKLLGKVWQSPHKWWRKLLATIHMTYYAAHPLLLFNFLLILPLMNSESPLLRLLPFLILSAFGPSLMYLTAVHAQNKRMTQPVRRLGVLWAVGIGLSVSNTRAVLEGLFGKHSEFKRTPKFALTNQTHQWQTSQYALPRDPVVWLELILALYAVALLLWAIYWGRWGMVPWLLLYVAGYGYVAGLSFVQAWQARAITSLATLEAELQ